MLTSIKDGKGAWTVVTGNKPYQFDQSHKNYQQLEEAVRADDEAEFLRLFTVGKQVDTWSGSRFRLDGGVLYFGLEVIHDVIADRIIECMREGHSYMNYENFLVRLYNNPSYNSVQQLYRFMVHKNLPITPDGFIIMWKAVRPDYTDKWTGKISNAPGQTPSMPRYQVVDDPRIACGPGLHAGSLQFVKNYGSYGDHVMMLKVDPSNVVSIPEDSNSEKVRTCGYEVLSEYETDILGSVYNPAPKTGCGEPPAPGFVTPEAEEKLSNSDGISQNSLDTQAPIGYNSPVSSQVLVDDVEEEEDEFDDEDEFEFDDDEEDNFYDDDDDDDEDEDDEY